MPDGSICSLWNSICLPLANKEGEKDMKRILSLMIAVSVILSLTVMPVSVSADISGANEGIGLLKILGIYQGEEDNGEYNVTRADFAVMLSNIIQANSRAVYQAFTDVPLDYYAADSIYTLYKMGLLKGKTANTFAPNDTMTVDEAMVILIRFLGYEELAEATGGYITGYYNIARDISLIKGFSYKSGDILTLGKTARIIENLLETEIFSVISVTKDGGYVKNTISGKTVAKVYFNLDVLEDIVYANEFTTYRQAQEMEEGMLTIGSRTFKTDIANASDYLGYEVKAYYNDEAQTVVYIKKTENNKTYKLTHKDIDIYEDNKLYFKNSNDYVEIPSTAVIIYNKTAITSFDKKLFDIEKGTIEFIDNDNDSEYDIIKILNYKNYIVDVANSKQQLLVLKDGYGSLDLEGTYEKVRILDSEGRLRDVGMINTDSVLTVLENKESKYIEIIYSNEGIQGVLDSYRFSDEESFVTISGVDYPASEYFKKEFSDIKAGYKGVFFIDNYGEVVNYIETGEQKSGFGYLISSTSYYNPDITLFVRMATVSDGIVKGFRVAEKIKIDGVRLKLEEACDKIKNAPSDIVYYELDADGYLCFLDTLEPDVNPSDKELKLLYDSWNTLETFREAGLSLDTTSSSEYVWLNENCAIISVPPSGPTDLTFDVYALDSLTNSGEYKYRAYQRNENGILADVITMPATTSSDTVTYSPYAYIRLIEKVSQVVSPTTGEIVNKIVYWERNTQKECYSIDLQTGSTLKPGDCVYLSLNAKNEMYYYQLLFENKTKTVQNNADKKARTGTHRFVYANIYDSYDSIYRLTKADPATLGNDLTSLEPHRYARYIYVVEELPNGNIKVTVGTGREMKDYVNFETDYSKVLIHEAYVDDMDLVIFQK